MFFIGEQSDEGTTLIQREFKKLRRDLEESREHNHYVNERLDSLESKMDDMDKSIKKGLKDLKNAILEEKKSKKGFFGI